MMLSQSSHSRSKCLALRLFLLLVDNGNSADLVYTRIGV